MTFTLDSLVLQAYQVFTVMYLENYILKMIRHQTVRFKFYKHIFFSYKNDRPIVVTLYSGVVMLQRAQGGCLGTESR